MRGANDVVYILKAGVSPEELRYSLRSIERNFHYREVWFYGGCPNTICPDNHVPFVQSGSGKLNRVMSTLPAIFMNDSITDSFYLMNDDFFIMREYDQDTYWYSGTLLEQAEVVKKRNHGDSVYTRRMIMTAEVLDAQGYGTLNYGVHVPMLVNRKLGLETLHTVPYGALFRSAYGNVNNVGGILKPDVKIVDNDVEPDADSVCLSTKDDSFRDGRAGAYIRSVFDAPCRYEL